MTTVHRRREKRQNGLGPLIVGVAVGIGALALKAAAKGNFEMQVVAMGFCLVFVLAIMGRGRMLERDSLSRIGQIFYFLF